MKTSSYLKGKTFLATLYNNTCIWCIHVYNRMSVIFSITILAWRNSTQVFFIIWYLYYKVSHTYWSRAKQRTVVSAFPYHICLRQFSIQCFKCNNQKIMWLSSSCLLKYKKGMKNIEYWFYMRKPPTNFSSHSNRHINSSTRVVCHFVSLLYTRICQSSSRWFKKPIELQIYI